MKTDTYRTSDLGLTAFLMVRGFPLLRAVPSGQGSRLEFVFAPDAEPLADEFYRGALVPANAYNHALRDAKTLLYARAR